MLQFKKQPIIVIGMHRSGTTMVVQLLEKMGVFMGTDKEVNSESLLFIELNEWIMKQVGARWDKPADMDIILKNNEYRDILVRFLSFIIKSPRFIRYLGVKGVFNILFRPNIIWGWKDPRNTFSLPLWLEIFPDAKIICVERNGIDVAKSLIVRKKKELKKLNKDFNLYKWYYSWKLKEDAFGSSAILNDNEDAINLWYQYVIKAREHIRSHKEKSLYIHYESLLSNPSEGILNLAKFTGISLTEKEVANVASIINASRANPNKQDTDFEYLSNKYRDILSVHDTRIQ